MRDQRGKMIFCSECQTETDHYNGHCGECFAENTDTTATTPDSELTAARVRELTQNLKGVYQGQPEAKAPEDPNTEIVAEIFGRELAESEESKEVVRGTIAEALTECADDLHSIGLMDDETRERMRELCQQPTGKKSELLPCPFCGSEDVVVGNICSSHYGICNDCEAEGPYSNEVRTESEAVIKWNTRHK